MIRSGKNYLCGAALAAIALTTSQPFSAQCISGNGATLKQISTQNFARSPPLDFSTYSLAGTNLGSGTLLPISNLVIDPAGGAVLLMDSRIFHPGITASQTGAESLMLTQVQFNRTPVELFAAGTVWAQASDGRIYNVNVGTTQQTGVYIGDTIEGAAFDGTYAWFSTIHGNLVKVQLPAATLPGVYTSTVMPFGQVPLGPLSFDGRHLWVAQGGTIYRLDPSTGQLAGSKAVGGTITSLFFDGVYMWVGNSVKGMVKFDATTLDIVDYLTPGGSGYQTILFDGFILSGFSNTSTQVTRTRACDGFVLKPTTLPNTPSQVVFDGTQQWITYTGSNVLSVR